MLGKLISWTEELEPVLKVPAKAELKVMEVGEPEVGLTAAMVLISYRPAFPIAERFPKVAALVVLAPITSSCICMMTTAPPTVKVWLAMLTFERASTLLLVTEVTLA